MKYHDGRVRLDVIQTLVLGEHVCEKLKAVWFLLSAQTFTSLALQRAFREVDEANKRDRIISSYDNIRKRLVIDAVSPGLQSGPKKKQKR